MTVWSLLLVAASVRTLVLPFDAVDDAGDTARWRTHWRGSAFEEAVSVHLQSAGHDVIDLETRNAKLRELGFIPGEPVSRATAIVLGKELDAKRLVVGEYRRTEDRLDVEARIIDLERGATVGVVEDFAATSKVSSLANQVAKNLFRLEAAQAPSGFDERAARRERLALGALEQSALARLSDGPDARRRHLEKALELEPGYLEVRLMLGELLLDANEPRKAIDVLVGAGDDVARDEAAYFDLGLAYLAVDEPLSALQVFSNLAKHEAFRAASTNNYGVALMRLKRFAPATDAFQAAVDEDSQNATYRFNLGWSLWRFGKGARALDELQMASELMPWDGQTQALLAAALLSQAQTEAASHARAAATLLAPGLADIDTAVVIGWARSVETSPATPERDITEGEDVEGLVELLEVRGFAGMGRLDDAIQLLQKGLYREPSAVELRRELVDLHRQAGDLEGAARELTLVLWTEPSVEAHLELARVYVELRQPVKASSEVEKALTLDPEHQEAKRLRDELGPPVIE